MLGLRRPDRRLMAKRPSLWAVGVAQLVAAGMACQLGGSTGVLVYEFWFCDDPGVEREQERELRQWAVALSEAAEREQRAMGRAILMLLEQVDSLRAELDQAASTPEPDAIDPAPAVDDEATSEVEADATPVEDTPVVGLRDRLRAVAHRGHD